MGLFTLHSILRMRLRFMFGFMRGYKATRN